MDLKCPSCGNAHRSEDHPGAFEILCACGYSLLVPDEKAFQVVIAEEDIPAAVDYSGGAPSALEESDPKIEVPSETESITNATPSFEALTPPEELPAGMIYDPFEIQNSLPTFDQSSPASDETHTHIPPSTPANSTRQEKPTAPELSGQWIVERSQSAAMGQFLGNSYKLQLEGLSREALVEISERALQLLKGRPWLETELRRKNILLEKLPDLTELEGVPELVAVEIYLAAFELGGKCRSSVLSS